MFLRRRQLRLLPSVWTTVKSGKHLPAIQRKTAYTVKMEAISLSENKFRSHQKALYSEKLIFNKGVDFWKKPSEVTYLFVTVTGTIVKVRKLHERNESYPDLELNSLRCFSTPIANPGCGALPSGGASNGGCLTWIFSLLIAAMDLRRLEIDCMR
jgi:hypothetical protein